MNALMISLMQLLKSELCLLFSLFELHLHYLNKHPTTQLKEVLTDCLTSKLSGWISIEFFPQAAHMIFSEFLVLSSNEV
jgi:hypothetical protein